MEQPHSTTAQRKWKQLTEKNRYRLEACFNADLKTQEIANRMGYAKRTIERERKLGLTPQLKPATKDIKTCGEIQTKLVYLADVAQRRHEERSANKGRNLKIGNDHRLVEHIEKKLKNGNRIPRRFFPKGTDFSTLKPKELQRIEDWVNHYPRKIFGYKTANDMYEAAA